VKDEWEGWKAGFEGARLYCVKHLRILKVVLSITVPVCLVGVLPCYRSDW
jgi:hypothetical protein